MNWAVFQLVGWRRDCPFAQIGQFWYSKRVWIKNSRGICRRELWSRMCW